MSIICLCAHAYQALLRLDRANHTKGISKGEILMSKPLKNRVAVIDRPEKENSHTKQLN